MEEEDPLPSTLATIRCFAQSLHADLDLIMEHHSCSSSSSSSLTEAYGKLAFDSAGYMRVSLRMYNAAEQHQGAYMCQASPESMLELEQLIRSTFVEGKLDELAAESYVALETRKNLAMIREHSLLLANTLRVMAAESSSVQGGELGQSAAAQMTCSKRQRSFGSQS